VGISVSAAACARQVLVPWQLTEIEEGTTYYPSRVQAGENENYFRAFYNPRQRGGNPRILLAARPPEIAGPRSLHSLWWHLFIPRTSLRRPLLAHRIHCVHDPSQSILP
jgi:hypothetical protein